MAKHGPQSAFLIVDAVDLSSQTFTLDDNVEGVLEQSNGLGVAWEEHLPVGIGKATLEAAGGIYDDDTVTSQMAKYQGRGATKQLVAWGMAGDVIGQEIVIVDGDYAAVWKRMTTRDGLTKAHATHTLTGRYGAGQILHANSAVTTAGDTESSGVDNNAADSNQKVTRITSSSVANPTNILCEAPHGLVTGDVVMIAGHTGGTPDINGEEVVTVVDTLNFTVVQNVSVAGSGGTCKQLTSQGCDVDLHLTALALGGYDSFDVELRDSDDDITYALVVAFTVATVVGAERKSVASQVERYTAMAWDWSGAGSAQAANPFVAISRL